MNSLRMSFWIVPGELLLRHALLLGGDDEAGEHRQHRAVHRHRHAHPVERDAVEQDLHVLDRVDRDAGLADIADDARMVAVVAAMGREIEGDRQPHLPGRQILAVEAVRFLGGREAGILPDRPRPVGVHRRARPAQIGREARHHVAQLHAGVLDRLEIGGGVERLDRDALGRLPSRGSSTGLPPQFGARQRAPVARGVFAGNAPSSAIVFSRARDEDYMVAAARASMTAARAQACAAERSPRSAAARLRPDAPRRAGSARPAAGSRCRAPPATPRRQRARAARRAPVAAGRRAGPPPTAATIGAHGRHRRAGGGRTAPRRCSRTSCSQNGWSCA